MEGEKTTTTKVVAPVERVVFALNGERQEVAAADVEPSTTLLEFIRTRTPFRGPKLGCGEGGCGACVILIAKYNPKTDEVTEFNASSCLTLLYSIHFCSIITTEGLGNTKDGFHSIQKRMSGFHASQCGFCTPGMCMSIFSSLVNADKSKKPAPPKGFSKLSVSEAERSFSGNMCRCTGYRPIVDACKSFASDVDLEDLGLNIFWKKGDKHPDPTKLPSYTLGGGICTFPDFLKSEIKSSLDFNDASISGPREGWYCPKSIKQYYKLVNSGLFSESSVKVVVGNTSTGVYKDQDLYDKYIDIAGIPELSAIVRKDKGIEIGAATSISRTIEILNQESESTSSPNGSVVFRKLAEHMSKVASPFVRNTASIGGNIILAHKYPFRSDIATILLGAAATVNLQVSSKTLHVNLEQFLEQPPLDHSTLLLSIFIPHWASDCKKEHTLVFETYRAAPRPLGNAVSYVNSAFLGHVSLDKSSGDNILSNLHLAFGAYGTKHAIRARKVEEYLTGKILSTSVVLEAIRLLRETIVPVEGTTHPEYRVSVAVGFLFSFLSPLCKGVIEPGKTLSISEDLVDTDNVHNKPLSSRRETLSGDEYTPVGDPIKKYKVEVQASEPLFGDPIAEFAGQALGVVIAETQRYADMAAKQAVVEYTTDGLKAPILIVEQAVQSNSYFQVPPERAPKQVGDFSNGMAEADHKIMSEEFVIGVTNFPQAISKAHLRQHSITSSHVKLASQYYFYMETQTALAIPDEDNTMTVYSSSQFPELAQNVISKCLGIPFNNVRVITRRVGGGFGGKAVRSLHRRVFFYLASTSNQIYTAIEIGNLAPQTTQSKIRSIGDLNSGPWGTTQIATAAALCAHTLRRPVRMYLNRNTDMIMVGGRHPMKARYSVGFKSDGKITALHLDLLINAGISADASPIIPGTIISGLKKYNWGALSFDVKLCKTNNTSKSVMRAPGETQGSLIAEAIIEHVAAVLSLDANTVRQKNFHSYDSLVLFYPESAGESSTYTLHSIFDRLASTSSYLKRAESIKKFNSCNKWRKRGISSVPLILKVRVRPAPGRVSVLSDGSIVIEVGGIELGQGLWTKVQQMAVYALGQLWPNGCEGLLDRIRVLQSDTLNLIQGGVTAGSTTSESSCAAALQACNMLVERLKPVLDRLQLQSGIVSWDTLISQVEIDLLTGAITILRSDLIYDSGKSLNPAVDLGQIEGSFIQGIGFFIYEEHQTNSDGLVISNSTWDYKIPSVDTIPKQFNVEVLNTGYHKNRVLSSKASGEPAVVLGASVHCAVREAIQAARIEFAGGSESTSSLLTFQLDVPAPMTLVKELCGLDIVEKYLEDLSSHGVGNCN
uniref:aldehyde oxidase n=1 Tax=Oryza barthii TaxID=65489 RepID=A0A0D3GPL5_9ORYZ